MVGRFHIPLNQTSQNIASWVPVLTQYGTGRRGTWRKSLVETEFLIIISICQSSQQNINHPSLLRPSTHSLPPPDIYQQHLQTTAMYSKVTNIRSNDSPAMTLGNGWRGDFIDIFPPYVHPKPPPIFVCLLHTHIIVLKYQPSSVLCTNLRIYPGHDWTFFVYGGW